MMIRREFSSRGASRKRARYRKMKVFTNSGPRTHSPMPPADLAASVSETALVLFSGGQDSATCLAWALNRYAHVETIGFDYGQRHAVELTCRGPFLDALRDRYPKWSQRLGADHVIDLRMISTISETALTRDVEIAFGENGLPTTFVPGRNLLFFNTAAAVGYRRGLRSLVGGMCETDYSGYPDCRDDTLKSLQVTLNLGMAMRFIIETPLMWLDKAATWELAEALVGAGFVELVVELTHTCYLGDRSRRHPWGYGCGECPACQLRANGFAKFSANRNVKGR
jgi:7-cyano-7-deazaguanine synthase